MLTDWERYQDNLGDIVKVWEGLGIPGGMLAGVLVGGYVGHVRRGIPLGAGLNAVAPALPLAQAIGRWGNYFNQERLRRPADRPASKAAIDQAPGYPPGTTFHPTFLYESLGNFALCGLLLWIDKRYRPPVVACWRCTCSATASAASGSRVAHRRCRRAGGLGGTSGCRSP